MIKKIIIEIEENGLYPDKISKKLGISKKEVIRLLHEHMERGLEVLRGE